MPPLRRALPDLLLLAVGLACASGAPTLPVPAELAHGIELDGSGGEDLLQIDPRRKGFTLSDASGHSLARFRIEPDAVRIETPAGQLRARVLRPVDATPEIRIVAGSGDERLYTLIREPDGDLRLVGASGELLYEIKQRRYGLKVTDAAGQLDSKVRVKPDKISIRNALGRTMASTRDPIPPVAAACLALRTLDIGYRAGLALAIIYWRTDHP
ncbi:MAG: hypothetical protein ACE5FG_13575 [Myxococcota bacterium]